MQVAANGIGIEIDDQGPPSGEPILLIMGLGMQLIGWPEELVQLLVARGFRVIRMDNRDIGLSQYFDHLGVPNLPMVGVKHLLHIPVRPPYTLADMAADSLGVLDALGIARAHVWGVSMGGMIAQHLAATHPQRLKSLCLTMTTSGARHLPQPPLHVRRALMSRPEGRDPELIVAHFQNLLSVIGSPAFPPEPARLRERLLASARRSWHPAGTARQIAAVIADGDRTPLLSRIQAPTCVIHGEADPLVPVEAGRDLARRIPATRSDFIAGMGHDLPAQLLPRFVQVVADNCARAAG